MHKPSWHDEEPAFLCAYARAMLHWQEVETTMAVVFGSLVGQGKDSLPGAVALAAITGTAAKLDAMNGAAQFVLSDEVIEAEWQPLLSRLEKASRKRNQLAHGMRTSTLQSDPPGMRYLIQASPLKFAKKMRAPVGQEEITQYAGEFMQLDWGCWKFHKLVLDFFSPQDTTP